MLSTVVDNICLQTDVKIKYNAFMSCVDLYHRITLGLSRNSPRWIPEEVIYAQMNKEGYVRFAVTSTLKKIAATPPFARIKIEGKDYRSLDLLGLNVGGVYYRASPITSEEVEKLKEDMVWYDAL